MCGRIPAATVTVRRHVGLVLAFKRHRVTAPLCREHGEILVREWTRKTLLQGWWSYRSWLLNIYALVTNHRAKRTLAALPYAFEDEHLGWETGAFTPKAAFDAQPRSYEQSAYEPATRERRPTFGSTSTFGDRLGSRAGSAEG
jgi:hypothetical protein